MLMIQHCVSLVDASPLGQCTSLTSLNLSGWDTHLDIARLATCTSLRYLRTNAVVAQVGQLLASLPECKLLESSGQTAG